MTIKRVLKSHGQCLEPGQPLAGPLEETEIIIEKVGEPEKEITIYDLKNLDGTSNEEIFKQISVCPNGRLQETRITQKCQTTTVTKKWEQDPSKPTCYNLVLCIEFSNHRETLNVVTECI